MLNKTSISIEKESIVKSLLTSTNNVNVTSNVISTVNDYQSPNSVQNSVTTKDSTSDSLEVINMDHCYARPVNWTPESAFFQKTKVLFLSPEESKQRNSINPLVPFPYCEDIDIDIETVPANQPELYDKGKAIHAMNECDRHAMFARADDEDEDWEDKISRLNWTPEQNLLFNGMVGILNSNHLARLAHMDAYHEPILRRVAVDKAVKRMRHLFATVSWNPRLTQWLHQLLVDNLSTSYLGAYFDILQTLKAKLPVFVDKMMFGPNANNRVGATSNESLFHLLKRPWDPFALYLSQNRPRKLPGNPVIIIVPSAPSISNPNLLKRQHKWITLLSNLATVVAVHTNMGSSANRLTMMNCADQMLAATRAKIQEVKSDYPGRQIVLIGFNVGSALALQVAQVEHVLCVVGFSFSLLTAEGKRGEPDDSLLELQCPVLFVIGQCSNTSSQEDVEDLRERMRVENGLIIVGFADDHLRLKKKKKRSEGITQSAVDRTIVENIGEFVSGLLLSPFPPQLRQSPIHGSSEVPPPKRMKMERKRNYSNGSSVDSEPPSPTPKITRPVGRPPGSKGKVKLDAKWAAQMAQGTPSPSPNTPPPLHTLSHSPLLPQPLSEITSNNKTSKNKFSTGDSQSSALGSNSNSTDVQNKVPSSTGSALANLLQNGCKGKITTPQSTKHHSSIKVLENVTLNSSSSAKLISGSTNRPFDLSKLSLLSSNNSKSAPVMLMPDGKIKSIGTTVKGTGNTPILLPMSKKLSTPMPGQRGTKYITSKKQLIGQRPPMQSLKSTIISSFPTNFPPPTNLTSQDIMDLPIIFADDNQMLTDSSKLRTSDVPVSEIVQPTSRVQKIPVSNPVGKFVFINKQMPITTTAAVTSNIVTTSTLKRPILTVPVRTANTPKYTKIIISRGSTMEPKSSTANVLSKISNLSPEISIRKVNTSPTTPVPTMEDLENAIVSTTIKKPDHHISQIKETANKEECETSDVNVTGSQKLTESNFEQDNTFKNNKS